MADSGKHSRRAMVADTLVDEEEKDDADDGGNDERHKEKPALQRNVEIMFGHGSEVACEMVNDPITPPLEFELESDNDVDDNDDKGEGEMSVGSGCKGECGERQTTRCNDEDEDGQEDDEEEEDDENKTVEGSGQSHENSVMDVEIDVYEEEGKECEEESDEEETEEPQTDAVNSSSKNSASTISPKKAKAKEEEEKKKKKKKKKRDNLARKTLLKKDRSNINHDTTSLTEQGKVEVVELDGDADADEDEEEDEEEDGRHEREGTSPRQPLKKRVKRSVVTDNHDQENGGQMNWDKPNFVAATSSQKQRHARDKSILLIQGGEMYSKRCALFKANLSGRGLLVSIADGKQDISHREFDFVVLASNLEPCTLYRLVVGTIYGDNICANSTSTGTSSFPLTPAMAQTLVQVIAKWSRIVTPTWLSTRLLHGKLGIESGSKPESDIESELESLKHQIDDSQLRQKFLDFALQVNGLPSTERNKTDHSTLPTISSQERQEEQWKPQSPSSPSSPSSSSSSSSSLPSAAAATRTMPEKEQQQQSQKRTTPSSKVTHHIQPSVKPQGESRTTRPVSKSNARDGCFAEGKLFLLLQAGELTSRRCKTFKGIIEEKGGSVRIADGKQNLHDAKVDLAIVDPTLELATLCHLFSIDTSPSSSSSLPSSDPKQTLEHIMSKWDQVATPTWLSDCFLERRLKPVVGTDNLKRKLLKLEPCSGSPFPSTTTGMTTTGATRRTTTTTQTTSSSRNGSYSGSTSSPRESQQSPIVQNRMEDGLPFPSGEIGKHLATSNHNNDSEDNLATMLQEGHNWVGIGSEQSTNFSDPKRRSDWTSRRRATIAENKYSLLTKIPRNQPLDPSKFACQLCLQGRGNASDSNLNAHITSELEKILEYRDLASDGNQDNTPFRKKAYMTAISQLKRLDFTVTNVRQLEDRFGFGGKIRRKIGEIIQNGYCMERVELDQEPKIQTLKQLINVHGIAVTTARKLYSKGYRSIEDLRSRGQHDLTPVQQIGLKYFEDLQLRMPREEAKEISDVVKETVRELIPGVVAEVCGSYRRGKPTVGDVDVILTHPGHEASPDILPLVERLSKQGFLLDHLSLPDRPGEERLNKDSDSHTYMGICKLASHSPDGEPRHARRLDIKAFPPKSFAFAVLYFTGSGLFNQSMRLWVHKHGYSLSDKGMFPCFRIRASRVVAEDRPVECYTERDIFESAGLAYVPPSLRG